MPEGPSIVILREKAAGFASKTIRGARGNAPIDLARLEGRRVKAIRSWGKHFLIELSGFSVRVHLLMFGTYCIGEHKPHVTPRLALKFDGKRELNFYTCAVTIVEGSLKDTYDWRTDIMSSDWDDAFVRKRLRAVPDTLVCDALLDQDVFTGVGNIIKNEVLFRVRVHPLSTLGGLPAPKLRQLVEQARVYGFEFLEQKKEGTLSKHWQAHTRRICPRCDIPFKLADLGKTKRRSFFCENCQKKYLAPRLL